MIVACPQCEAKYRVDPARVGPDGARLRCAKCQSVFRVQAPAAPTPAVAPVPAAVAAPPVERAAPSRSPRPSPVDPTPDRERMVLIADSDAESAKEMADALTNWGLAPVMVLDGVEAILSIQRLQPRVVILDAGLTKMYGFQVCEIVKRNESLRSIRVVLIGSVHHADRYRRPPVELYGADVYLEKPDVPDALLPCLRQFGMSVPGMPDAAAAGVVPEPAAPAPAPVMPAPVMPAPVAPPVAPPVAQPAPITPAPAAVPQSIAAPPSMPAADEDPALEAQRATAERLARIIVSDIILYNPDKFEEALRTGTVAEAMDGDLEEGRALFRQRIDERVRNEKDHLREELLRVARGKGMT